VSCEIKVMTESNSPEALKASSETPLLQASESLDSKPNYVVKTLKNYTGFTKTFNVVLFSLTALIFAAYCMFRLPDLNYESVWGKRAAPGEWYWFRQGRYRVGMTMHLWSVLRKLSLINICQHHNPWAEISI